MSSSPSSPQCFAESATVLWTYTRRCDYPPQSAQQDVSDLIRLRLQVVPTAALGDRLSLPMVTADEALARRLQETDRHVRFLGE